MKTGFILMIIGIVVFSIGIIWSVKDPAEWDVFFPLVVGIAIFLIGLIIFLVGLFIKKGKPKEESVEAKREPEFICFENKHDKCPYCESTNITRMLMEEAISSKERETLGYQYKYECECSNCNSRWESIEK